ncbi:EAL and HDOD domain-containing protein [Pseudobacillus badius]|uniref:EAL and HDOD domain-containing protein n=1 Tax=Bacillus badius TaxID=1455 RepID=UPI000AF9FC6F|nr:EAL domain-containing protein [Bacillus badius]
MDKMDVYVARQPIFNREEQTVAYELLYRNKEGKHPGKSINGDEATIEVLSNSILTIGVDQISRGKKLYVNFTENLLLQDFPIFLPSNKLVIELLEQIEANAEVEAACQQLKAKGYTLALDDFLLSDSNKELIKYADIIKVDFLDTTKAERKRMKEELAHFPLTWLAEKVETREQLQEALDEGFDLFQGFFFARPTIVSAKSIPQFSGHYFVILDEMMGSEPDILKIAHLIESDLSLSYKLLKLLNRTAFIQRQKVKTIHQAIMLIGLEELRKWFFFIMISSSGSACPEEVVHISLVRAKTLELLALHHFREEPPSLFFLLGMLSMIDALINQPMDKLLQDLPIDERIKQALLFKEGTLFQLLRLITAAERGHWGAVSEISRTLQVEESALYTCYQNALEWADSMIKAETGQG